MASPDSPGAPLLSPSQRRLAGFAVAALSAAVLLGCVAAVFKALAMFFAVFGGALWPLIVAIVLSFLLEPVCTFLEKRFGLSRIPSIIILYVLVILVAAAIGFTLLPRLWDQLVQMAHATPDYWKRASETLGSKFPEASKWMREGGVMDWVRTHTEEIASAALGTGSTLNGAKHHVASFIALVTGFALIPVYLFYLLDLRRDFVGDLERESAFLPKNIAEDLVFLTRQFIGILTSFFRGQLLVGLSVGALLAIGFGAVGLSYGLLLGLIIGLLNVIPYLGTMLGLATVLPLAFFQDGGGAGKLGAVALVFVIVQIIDGYLITPRIMGKSTGLHPMMIIFSIFFWGCAFDGLLGMVLAVPLTAFFVVVWRLVRTKYLPALRKERELRSAEEKAAGSP